MWYAISSSSLQVSELYTLLNENYVEDDDCTFRFDYSKPFLQWALTPPGFHPNWHVGVRNTKTGALWGCITAIPVLMRVYGKVISMAEINFLCVHKKLRYVLRAIICRPPSLPPSLPPFDCME